MKKILIISLSIGLVFSTFYLISSSLVCRFVFECSIEFKNYLYGALIISFIVTIIVSLILGIIWYIYKVTKV